MEVDLDEIAVSKFKVRKWMRSVSQSKKPTDGGSGRSFGIPLRDVPLPSIENAQDPTHNLPEEAEQKYAKRARHKTKADRYDYKEAETRKSRHNVGIGGLAQQNAGRDKFRAKNLVQGRLTNSNPNGIGLFSMSKVSRPLEQRDLADLAVPRYFLESHKSTVIDQSNPDVAKARQTADRRKNAQARYEELVSAVTEQSEPRRSQKRCWMAGITQGYNQDVKRTKQTATDGTPILLSKALPQTLGPMRLMTPKSEIIPWSTFPAPKSRPVQIQFEGISYEVNGTGQCADDAGDDRATCDSRPVHPSSSASNLRFELYAGRSIKEKHMLAQAINLDGNSYAGGVTKLSGNGRRLHNFHDEGDKLVLIHPNMRLRSQPHKDSSNSSHGSFIHVPDNRHKIAEPIIPSMYRGPHDSVPKLVQRKDEGIMRSGAGAGQNPSFASVVPREAHVSHYDLLKRHVDEELEGQRLIGGGGHDDDDLPRLRTAFRHDRSIPHLMRSWKQHEQRVGPDQAIPEIHDSDTNHYSVLNRHLHDQGSFSQLFPADNQTRLTSVDYHLHEQHTTHNDRDPNKGSSSWIAPFNPYLKHPQPLYTRQQFQLA